MSLQLVYLICSLYCVYYCCKNKYYHNYYYYYLKDALHIIIPVGGFKGEGSMGSGPP